MYGRGAWRSPVARLLWEQEVGGSNPLAPTIFLLKKKLGRAKILKLAPPTDRHARQPTPAAYC